MWISISVILCASGGIRVFPVVQKQRFQVDAELIHHALYHWDGLKHIKRVETICGYSTAVNHINTANFTKQDVSNDAVLLDGRMDGQIDG